MCSGTGNDQYSLMEYELAELVPTLMVLVVDTSCIFSRLNMGGLLGPWKVEELPLTEASQCGLARGFSHYFGTNCSVLAQQFYTTARHCIRRIVFGIGNGRTERAAESLTLVPFCPALIWHENCDRLGKVVLHFGNALAARGVLNNVELGSGFLST